MTDEERGVDGGSGVETEAHGHESCQHPKSPAPMTSRWIERLETTLVKYKLEGRGVQRVEPHERHELSWKSYLQAFTLWISINLAAVNITLGMLAPVVYSLSFKDASLCAVFGSLLGSAAVAYIATWGPVSGNRTMIFTRYTFGWWPSKLIVILNLIVFLGYSMIDLVVAGQILSAVSAHYSLTVVVGIIIVAVISWLITTFGISLFHTYQRYAFLPQLVAICIFYGVAGHTFDLTTPSAGDPRTVTGNRISFFSLCFSAAITYAGGAADFFVYYPPSTPRLRLFIASLLGLIFSFTLTILLGIGLASGIPSHPSYASAYNDHGSGALLVTGLSNPLDNFGKFLAVAIALGLIANVIAPTYSSGIDFQILGRATFARVPRAVWNTVGIIIYTVCALAGRNHLSEIFTNFLALMGYWVAIWIAITVEEQLLFRRQARQQNTPNESPTNAVGNMYRGYDWTAWNTPSRLPLGLAALVSFLVGWAGAILCMAQVWYVGPLARLVGDDGADVCPPFHPFLSFPSPSLRVSE